MRTEQVMMTSGARARGGRRDEAGGGGSGAGRREGTVSVRGDRCGVRVVLARETLVKARGRWPLGGEAGVCRVAARGDGDFFVLAGENDAKEVLTGAGGVSNLWEIRWKPMPDQPSPDKVSLSVRIPRTLAQRLKRLAAERGEPVSELLTWIFTRATNDVELTPDDYRKIADDTERALQLQAAKGSARKALDARFKKQKGAA